MIEEAVEEEIWAAVANLIATEEHLLETARMMEDTVFYAELSSFVRVLRQELTTIVMKLRGFDPELDAGRFRTGLGELWCATKHLLLVKVHLYETAQKLAKMGKREEAKKCISLSQAISNMIEDFLDRIFGGGESGQESGKIDGRGNEE